MIDKLTTKFKDAVATVDSTSWPTLRVRPDSIVALCKFAKNDPDLNMDYLVNLTAVDWEDRLETIYHLWSTPRKEGLILRVDLPREDPKIDTVTGIWRAANWFEREVYDMFGIVFEGHPDLRRILMPEDTVSFPLRKDFTFIDDPDDPIALEPKT